MKARSMLLLLLACAAPVAAQDRTRELEQQRQDALQRLEDAQKQLQDAIAQLRKEQSSQVAQTQLRDAIRALERAQWALNSRFITEQIQQRLREAETRVQRFDPREYTVVTSWGDYPRMGVVLSSGGLSSDAGVRLQAVTPSGPADQAGLKGGDVLTKANGVALVSTRGRDANDLLTDQLRKLEDGDTLRVEYRRDGQTKTTNVVVKNLDAGAYVRISPRIELTPDSDRSYFAVRPQVSVAAPLEFSGFLSSGWLDVELTPVNPELGKYFGTTDGLLVVRAPKDQSLKLQGGDVILSIDGRKPESPSHAMRIFGSYSPGETMKLEVMRDKKRQTLSVTVPERHDGFLWNPGGNRR